MGPPYGGCHEDPRDPRGRSASLCLVARPRPTDASRWPIRSSFLRPTLSSSSCGRRMASCLRTTTARPGSTSARRPSASPTSTLADPPIGLTRNNSLLAGVLRRAERVTGRRMQLELHRRPARRPGHHGSGRATERSRAAPFRDHGNTFGAGGLRSNARSMRRSSRTYDDGVPLGPARRPAVNRSSSSRRSRPPRTDRTTYKYSASSSSLERPGRPFCSASKNSRDRRGVDLLFRRPTRSPRGRTGIFPVAASFRPMPIAFTFAGAAS